MRARSQRYRAPSFPTNSIYSPTLSYTLPMTKQLEEIADQSVNLNGRLHDVLPLIICMH
jgi:hypothetical protein